MTTATLPEIESLGCSPDAARALQARLQADWRFFYQKVLQGPPLWAKQELLWDSVIAHQRTLVMSGHATGKDFTIGRLVPWFLLGWAPAIVITTAPTDRQVRKVIWGEIHAAVRHSPIELGGKLLEQEWVLGEKHYAIGFTTRDYANASQRFHGFHQEHVLIVLSEAAGIHPTIWESLEGLAIGEHVRILAVSQPTGDAGPFYEAIRTGCRKGVECRCANWHLLDMSSWEAAEANARLGIKGLATTAWCEERKAQWGEDSPLYQARVLGQVPMTSVDRIIALSWAVRATELELSSDGPGGVGVDVAWKGDDDSVITVVRGARQTRREVLHGQDTIQVTGRTLQVLREEGLKSIAVDVGGIGAGVYDNLQAASGELTLNVIGVNFGARADEETLYVDKAAEMWWQLREELRLGTFQTLPGDEQIAQMTSRKCALDRKGRIQLEKKDELRRRGLPSPDQVDSLVLAREAQRQHDSLDLIVLTAEKQAEEDQAVWTVL